MEKKWAELSPEERREERFRVWLAPPDVEFATPEAAQLYRERVQRLIDVIRLQVPDRVPTVLNVGFYPAAYAGITHEEAMYDYDKLCRAWRKYYTEFDLDVYSSAGVAGPGKVFEILDYKVYRWPGHGTPPDTPYQCLDSEYMKADDYDALIEDPSAFWMRVYLPRVFGALAPLRELHPFTKLVEMPSTGPAIMRYGRPDVQAALRALLEAGSEALRWFKVVKALNNEALASGLPRLWGAIAKAPFDTIGDTLRGTQGIMLDMYRQPDKLLAAMERMVPITIAEALDVANEIENPLVFMPLHKGAEGFMSEKQYHTFYWPTLRKVILGLIEEGLVPWVFAEGRYEARLAIVKDLPRGSTIWHFDQTDMARAKEVLGDTACIAGNVPSSLLTTSTPDEVKDYCRGLIEVAGRGGGFILTSGAAIEAGRADNLRAMMEAAREYGVYR